MIIVTKNPIDPALMYDRIRKSESGSVLMHYAVVKSKAGGERASAGIHFEKAGNMEEELSSIADYLKQRWNLEDVLLVRRIGTLEIGEIISLTAVSSSACRHGLERLKKMATLKKTERFLAKERGE